MVISSDWNRENRGMLLFLSGKSMPGGSEGHWRLIKHGHGRRYRRGAPFYKYPSACHQSNTLPRPVIEGGATAISSPVTVLYQPPVSLGASRHRFTGEEQQHTSVLPVPVATYHHHGPCSRATRVSPRGFRGERRKLGSAFAPFRRAFSISSSLKSNLTFPVRLGPSDLGLRAHSERL